MRINQNRIYINLKRVEDKPKMFVARQTRASVDLELSCGDVLEGTRAAICPVTIEYCQLTPDQFGAWLGDQKLDEDACVHRYGLCLEEVHRLLGRPATAGS